MPRAVPLGVGTLLAVMGLVAVMAPPASAEVVLCKSRFLSIVKAREGSCRRGETEVPLPQGPQGEKGDKGDTGPAGPAGQGTRSYYSALMAWSEREVCFNDGVTEPCADRTQLTYWVHEGHPLTTLLGSEDLVLTVLIEKKPDGQGVRLILRSGEGPQQISQEIHLSASQPFYAADEESPFFIGGGGTPAGFQLHAALLSDSMVQLQPPYDFAVLTDIVTVDTESYGGLAAEVEQPSATEADVNVQVQNTGGLETNYIVSIRACDVEIEEVVAQSLTLEAGEQASLSFHLRTNDVFDAGDECMVRLQSTTGRVYDQDISTRDIVDDLTIVFPGAGGA